MNIKKRIKEITDKMFKETNKSLISLKDLNRELIKEGFEPITMEELHKMRIDFLW